MNTNVRLRVVRGEVPGKTYALKERVDCTIGRSEDCMLRLPNNPLYMDVSRHHCLVHIEPAEVRVRDLGSRNGTYVNDIMIGKRRSEMTAEATGNESVDAIPLHNGDELRVGGTVFRVCISSGEETAEGSTVQRELAAV
jgi:eukaryotic-like serine/threonine-protein kinase